MEAKQTKVVFNFPGGKIKDNVETLGAVSSKTWTVPAYERWIILGGYVERDTSATLTGKITDSAGKNIMPLFDDISAGTTNIFFPRDAFFPSLPIAEDGQKIVITWGAAQTSPEVALAILVMESVGGQ